MEIVDPIKNPEDIIAFTEFLHKHATPKIFTIWVFGVNTGLRISDLLSLKWKDIIMPDDEKCDWSFVQKAGKTKKVHKVFLCDMIRKSLIALHVSYPKDVYIFQSDFRRGKGKMSVKKTDGKNQGEKGKSKAKASPVAPITRGYVSLALAKYGRMFNPDLHLSSHSMRKTCAYALRFERNVELEIVSKILQHSSIAITMRYFSLSEEETRQALINANIGERKENSEEVAIAILKREFKDPYVLKAFSCISCFNDFSFFNSRVRLRKVRTALVRILDTMIFPPPKDKSRISCARETVDTALNYCRSIYDMQIRKGKISKRRMNVMEKDAETGLAGCDYNYLVSDLCQPRRKTISPLTDIQDELEELDPPKKKKKKKAP